MVRRLCITLTDMTSCSNFCTCGLLEAKEEVEEDLTSSQAED